MQEESPPLQYLAAPYFSFSLNEDLELQSVSQSWLPTLGYSQEECVGVSFQHFLADDPLNEGFLDACLQLLRMEGELSRSGYRMLRDASGNARVIHCQFNGQVDPAGQVNKLIGLGRDLTSEWPSFPSLYDEMQQLGHVHEQLKPREQVVLGKVLSGRLNKSIARELEVSERTIELDRKKLIEKFQVANSAELICKASRFALMQQLFEDLGRHPFEKSAANLASANNGQLTSISEDSSTSATHED